MHLQIPSTQASIDPSIYRGFSRCGMSCYHCLWSGSSVALLPAGRGMGLCAWSTEATAAAPVSRRVRIAAPFVFQLARTEEGWPYLSASARQLRDIKHNWIRIKNDSWWLCYGIHLYTCIYMLLFSQSSVSQSVSQSLGMKWNGMACSNIDGETFSSLFIFVVSFSLGSANAN